MGGYIVDGVSKIYGDLHALDNVSLQVETGEWLSVVGSSGSGKSTLMNILGCLDSPTKGTVSLDGMRLDKLDELALATMRRQKIGLIFQQFHLVKHLTAVENVMLAQYYHSIPDEKEALAALDRIGMRERATHLPHQLSGGEQQRVCVARALINHPEVILADEPTGNLDEANEQIVIDFFHQLHDEGTTLIVVTHDQTVASQGTRQILLDHGRVTKEIKGHPAPKQGGKARLGDFGAVGADSSGDGSSGIHEVPAGEAPDQSGASPDLRADSGQAPHETESTKEEK